MAETKDKVATQPLFIGRARAHNVGDVVPAENIEANGWEEKVATVGTKAADKALAQARPEEQESVEQQRPGSPEPQQPKG
jgi:hypothetical protein